MVAWEKLAKHVKARGTRNQQHAATQETNKSSSPLSSKYRKGVTLKESLDHPSLHQFFTHESEVKSYQSTLRK